MQDDTKLTAIEERMAHLTRSVDDLSDIVARQDQQIDKLQRYVSQLRLRAAETEAEQASPEANQPPPHW